MYLHLFPAPAYWGDYYETCNGDRQSPVNIPQEGSASLEYDENMMLDTLEFRNYDKTFNTTISNNGHTSK